MPARIYLWRWTLVLLCLFAAAGFRQVVWAQAACQTNNDCLPSKICQLFHGPVKVCQTFKLFVNTTTPGASQLSFGVDSNAGSFTLSSCLGDSTVCGTPSTKPSFWTSYGSNTFHTVTLTGLRPGRTYTVSLYGVVNTGLTASTTATATTWPLPAFTPTVSTVGQSSATIDWTTPFSGNSKVSYATAPASWANQITLTPGDRFTGVASLSTGDGWAVTYNSGYYRQINSGSWVKIPATFTNTRLRSVDAYDSASIWIVGDNAALYHSTDNGSTWNSTPPPSGFVLSLYSVVTPASDKVWAVGQDQSIVSYNGGNWTLAHAGIGSENLLDVSTIDGHNIWAVGTNGYLISSNDGGATWAVTTLPNGGGQTVYFIATLDGVNIWAGGSGGTLWRSINGGQTWLQQNSGTTSTLTDAQFITPSELLLFTSNQIGRSTNADTGSPIFSYSPQSIVNNAGTATIMSAANYVLAGDSLATYNLCNSVCSIQSSPTVSTTHSAMLSGLSGGTAYYFAAESFGSGVGWGEFGTFTTANPDTIPPTVAFVTPLSPGPVYTNTSPYPVSGTANDTAPGTVQSVTLTRNGTNQTVAGATTWSSSVPLVAGLNSLVATATDGGGNTATANSSLFYDTTKPSVNITVPANNATVNVTPTTISGTAGDNDQVAKVEMTLNGGPRTAITITPSASVNWSTTATLVTGSNTIMVFATDRAGNEQSAQVTVTYVAPTFTLSASPASQNGFVGEIKSYTVTLTSQNSFSGAVNLSASVAPSGPTTSFASASVNLSSGGTASTTMDVATANTSSGTYIITITAISGTITRTTTVQMILSATPDFSLSATPSPLNIVAGNASSYQVTVSANNTFAGPIAFTLTGSPAGVIGAFNPTSVTLANSQTINSIVLNITTQASTVNGDYTLSITGNGTNNANGAAISHTSTVILHISPPPDVGLDFQPPQQTVNAGGPSNSFNGTITSLNGYGGTGTPVTFTATSDYAGSGLTLSLAPSLLMMAAGDVKNTALNVTAANNVPGGTYLVTIVARGSGLPASGRQTTVNLVVVEDTAPPVISNISATPNYNNVRITWTTNELADSSISIYTDAARANLVGTINDATGTVSGHNLLYQPLTPITTYYFTVSSTDLAPTPHTTTAVTDPAGQALRFTTLDTPDTTPPTVTLAQPADSQPPTTVFGSVTVSGTASDDKNVSQIHLTITNQTAGTTEPPIDTTITCTGQNCSYSYSWSTTAAGPAGNGLHTVTVVAKDAAGNLSPALTHTVNVDNDYTAPQVTSGPEATGLVCGATTCEITITWTTDDASTSEVGYDTPTPSYCDPNSGFCVYTQHQRYDDTAPSNSSPIYTSHQVTLTGLEKNVIYHYSVQSCNRSSPALCLQTSI